MATERSHGFVFSATTKDKPPHDDGGLHDPSQKQKTSFRDMVPEPRKKVDLLKENLAKIFYHNDTPLLPNIFDHYLTVQCWSPHFISPTAKIDRMMV